jgi:hypothetical protein
MSRKRTMKTRERTQRRVTAKRHKASWMDAAAPVVTAQMAEYATGRANALLEGAAKVVTNHA